MSLFETFLTQLKAKVAASTAYKQVVIEVCREVVGVTLQEDTIISLKEGVLTLRVSPTLKSALLLKQQKLLSEFSSRNLPVKVIR